MALNLNSAMWHERATDLQAVLAQLQLADQWIPRDSRQRRDLHRLIRSTRAAIRHAKLRHDRAAIFENSRS